MDPSVEILKEILESEAGRKWFEAYLGKVLQNAQYHYWADYNGMHIMMSFHGYHVGVHAPKIQEPIPKQSKSKITWLKNLWK